MWFANEECGVRLFNIDGKYVSRAIQNAIEIRRSLRIKLLNKYNIAYKKVCDGLNYDEIKVFEKKYSIKIIEK